MSNEQPPNDDEQAAEYQRADASRFPTTPAGQEAAIEGALTAGTFEQIADELNRRRVPVSRPTAALMTDMVELFGKYERETAAARAAQGDTNPYDLAPYEDVHGVTNEYDAARASDDPRALDVFLDNLAEDFHLDDVRALRTASAAVQAAMGRIALAAREKGMSPDRIGAETGYTASRITQFIREEKQRRAANSLIQYTWRIDIQDLDGTWLDDEFGDNAAAPADLPRLAEDLLTATGAHDKRARIFVWTAGESAYAEADAVYTAERDPQ
ncbi:hypothetical protein ACFWAA_33500 [Streptomyces sp. NPDC059922]|uniref:hypothetical protein n=1 Tax=Streptomyces sp. NPDC059922 TaxID=3347005 RepID=UPI0036545DDB